MRLTFTFPSRRCDVCLMYPPYLIALACIHMAAVVNKKDVKVGLNLSHGLALNRESLIPRMA